MDKAPDLEGNDGWGLFDEESAAAEKRSGWGLFKDGDDLLTDDVEGNLVQFGNCLDISEVIAHYDSMYDYLNSGQDIYLDAENLEKVDAAGLQLLFSFIQSSTRKRVSIQWVSISDELKRMIDCMGFSGPINMDQKL